MSKPTTEEELTYDQIISNRAKKIISLIRLLKYNGTLSSPNRRIANKIHKDAIDILTVADEGLMKGSRDDSHGQT